MLGKSKKKLDKKHLRNYGFITDPGVWQIRDLEKSASLLHEEILQNYVKIWCLLTMLCKTLPWHMVKTLSQRHWSHLSQDTAIKQDQSVYALRSKPFLGATPDVLLFDDCLIEVKRQYAGKNGKHFRCLDYNEKNLILLKRTSNYYYQVQGQLHICQNKSCYFVVYTFRDLFVEKINYDEEYWTGSLVPKLETFYTKFFRPFIAFTLWFVILSDERENISLCA